MGRKESNQTIIHPMNQKISKVFPLFFKICTCPMWKAFLRIIQGLNQLTTLFTEKAIFFEAFIWPFL